MGLSDAPAPAPELGPTLLRRLYSEFPSGVVAIAGLRDRQPVGLAASSFTSVSLEPPLVSVCVAHTSTTWPLLAELPAVGISVLSAEHTEVCRILAAPGIDRFAELSWTSTASGAVLITDAGLWLDCLVHDVVPAGDHSIILLRVVDGGTQPDSSPLVFHRSGFSRLAR